MITAPTLRTLPPDHAPFPTMIRRILNALLVSAVATGAAILVIRKLDPPSRGDDPETAPHEIDADSLAEDEKESLLQELDAQI